MIIDNDRTKDSNSIWNDKKAIIDVETWWDNSFEILNHLLELKNGYEDVSDTFKEFNVTDDQWQITEILACSTSII